MIPSGRRWAVDEGESKVISNLLAVKASLNANSDELNKRILAFEDEMNKLAVGLAVWIKLDNEIRLGYIRFEKVWHLVIEHNQGGDKEIQVLTHATRYHRLFCYRHLRELLPALLETATKFNSKIEAALKGDKEEVDGGS
jgi:hypothetical protein